MRESGIGMARLRAPLLALLLPLACTEGGTAISAPGGATCHPTTSAQNAAAAASTSAVRRGRGLPALRPDARLARAAAGQACDMARRGVMSHRGTVTSGPMQRAKAEGYAPRIVAENIGAGPYDEAAILAVWAGSRGHVDNILIPALTDFGIGSALGADGRTVYWSAVYAAPR